MNRRDVLRSAAVMGAVGAIGVPAFSGSAFAEEHGGIPLCGKLDVFCAIDTSGSLSSSESANLEDGINAFIDRLPTDDSVRVGSVEFGNNGVRNKNDLQAPDGLTVTIGSTGGNTPMPAAMDVADQALYGDAGARPDADKLVIVFTDGGPNYTNRQYSVGGLNAPRDDSTDWSAESGDSPAAYDNEGTAPTGNDGRQVTVAEMDETKLVAMSIKSGAVGGGATQIATVYVGDVGEDQQAMGTDAVTKYTDLPTYLANNIATSTDFAIDVDVANVEGLADQLITVLADACEPECPDCPENFAYKFEWTEDDEAAGECAGEFVIYDADDNVVAPGDLSEVSLVGFSCDKDGEPQEACFETTLCEITYEVKAGRDSETVTVTPDANGEFCVDGLTSVKGRGNVVTHAISNIVFTCPASDE